MPSGRSSIVEAVTSALRAMNPGHSLAASRFHPDHPSSVGPEGCPRPASYPQHQPNHTCRGDQLKRKGVTTPLHNLDDPLEVGEYLEKGVQVASEGEAHGLSLSAQTKRHCPTTAITGIEGGVCRPPTIERCDSQDSVITFTQAPLSDFVMCDVRGSHGECDVDQVCGRIHSMVAHVAPPAQRMQSANARQTVLPGFPITASNKSDGTAASQDHTAGRRFSRAAQQPTNGSGNGLPPRPPAYARFNKSKQSIMKFFGRPASSQSLTAYSTDSAKSSDTLAMDCSLLTCSETIMPESSSCAFGSPSVAMMCGDVDRSGKDRFPVMADPRTGQSPTDSVFSIGTDDEGSSPRSVLNSVDGSRHAASTADIAAFVAGYMRVITKMIPKPLTDVAPCEARRELAAANGAIACYRLPDGVAFSPVHPECALLPLVSHCNIPPIALALGASYFQRLASAYPAMRAAADDAGWFVNVPASTVMVPIERSSSHEDGHVLTQQGPVPAWTATGGRVLAMRAAPGPGSMSLFVIYLTCVYLGCKIGDRVAYKGLLSAMLTALMKKDVTTTDAVRLEAQCVQRLDFRLGPYYQCLLDSKL